MSLSSNIFRRSVTISKGFTSSAAFSTQADPSTNLKEVLAKKISAHNVKVKEFRKEHGSTVVQQINVDMIYGGMRTMKGMVTETSVLDAEEGIRLRGYSVPECEKLLPKAKGGQEPLPEGLWWLLCTGDIPTSEQATAITNELNARAVLPAHVARLLDNFPLDLHPMAQFVAAIAALNKDSKFSAAYARGAPKSAHWEYAYEDSMDMLAKLPIIAAKIYRNVYRDGSAVGAIDPKKDWSANFSAMLGYKNDPIFNDLMRLYLTLHADHEGGNVSAHTSHLVGSALADPYLCFSASMCGLAGPLHGRASQEVLDFLNKIVRDIGFNYSEEQLKQWIWKHLKSGQVVPGYGHAVLRKTDPRYESFRGFALKHLPNDNLFKLVSALYKVTPDILLEQGKAKNPWPNVDSHSGVLLQYFGMTEMPFYTVVFGVSRAMGCLSQLIWSRGMGLPIERPKSHSTEGLIKLAKPVKKN